MWRADYWLMDRKVKFSASMTSMYSWVTNGKGVIAILYCNKITP